uniref:NADH dehydrogenase subunit 2 n=1 Tax=Coptotriche turpinia TaxID=2984363 RepID=UPI002237874B|nr:NADH dehydrogenase subunit 2 [Coptotriche turpinia]UYB79004.1 NADH dehydrogenase subunit 2 [Coptotriche turpinia]
MVIFFFNNNNFLFFMILFFSTLITISSNSWLGCWIGLEINLLSFIPLISNTMNLMSTESALKYFLVQSIASINFIFFVLLSLLSMNLFYNELTSLLMNSSIFMKMGAAPFHFWFPNIIEGLSWMNCFLLMTWQKIPPMIIFSYMYNFKFTMMICTISALVGAVGGLNQMSLRKILTFSSINHISWMILAMLISENLWNFYFSVYFFMMMTICFMFNTINCSKLNQIFFINYNNILKILFFINFLSLGGLPPFLGFLPKWMIINFLLQNNMILIMFVLVMSVLMTLFFYLRMSYSSLIFNTISMKFMKNMSNIKNKMMMITLSMNSILSMIIITMIFYLY